MNKYGAENTTQHLTLPQELTMPTYVCQYMLASAPYTVTRRKNY